jgi:hypothetical protein
MLDFIAPILYSIGFKRTCTEDSACPFSLRVLMYKILLRKRSKLRRPNEMRFNTLAIQEMQLFMEKRGMFDEARIATLYASCSGLAMRADVFLRRQLNR